jgi:hypothetical protein
MGFTTGGWVQEGYYGGALGGPGSSCTTRSSTLGNYEEYWMNPSVNQTYFCWDFRNVAFNYVGIYRIQFNSISQAWDVFYDYNHWLDDPNYGGLISGAGCSSAEIYNCHEKVSTCGSATIGPEMPLTISGYSDPNTNDAMRLDGAHGYESWDQSLTADYTAAYDERNPTIKYYISPFYYYYKFETHS